MRLALVVVDGHRPSVQTPGVFVMTMEPDRSLLSVESGTCSISNELIERPEEDHLVFDLAFFFRWDAGDPTQLKDSGVCCWYG